VEERAIVGVSVCGKLLEDTPLTTILETRRLHLREEKRLLVKGFLAVSRGLRVYENVVIRFLGRQGLCSLAKIFQGAFMIQVVLEHRCLVEEVCV